MDTLETSLSRLYQTAHQLTLLLGEDFNSILPYSTALKTNIQQMDSSLEPAVYAQTDYLSGAVQRAGRIEEESPILQPFAAVQASGLDKGSLFPPTPDSYRMISAQMLEDMRRRSTIPLDCVRTVIL